MSTINSKAIILTMLKNNGVYPGDPQCYSIYQYENSFNGDICWAVFYNDYCDIYESPYCLNPVLLFDKSIGLTNAGLEMINEGE